MLAMREPSSRPGTAVGTGRAFFLLLLIPFLWPLGDVRAEDNLDAMQAEISGHIQANELPEARKAAEKYRELLEKTVGQSDSRYGDAMQNLAAVALMEADFTKAETFAKRAIEIFQRLDPVEKNKLAGAMGVLASVYGAEGKSAEAQALIDKMMALFGEANPEQKDLLVLLNRMTALDPHDAKNFDELESIYQTLIAAFDDGTTDPNSAVITTRASLANLYGIWNRCTDAVPLYELVIKDQESKDFKRGDNRSDYADCLVKLDRVADAKALYSSQLESYQKTMGPDSNYLITPLTGLAKTSLVQHRPEEALAYSRRAVAAKQHQFRLGIPSARAAEVASTTFDLMIEAAWEVARTNADRAMYFDETFSAAQLSGWTPAADAIRQLGSRYSGNPEAAHQIRLAQDLRTARSEVDRQLVDELAGVEDQKKMNALRAKLTALEQDLSQAEAKLAKIAPAYSAVVAAQTTAPKDLQKILRPDEALVLEQATEFGTFVWIVTRSDMRWVRSGLVKSKLEQDVATLRCGLDRDGEWQWSKEKGRWLGRKPVCMSVRPEGLEPSELAPFDLARAHKLYKYLFAEIDDLIKGKQLLLVPSGPLTSLPFQVLVTTPASGDDLSTAAWLIRDHALTVLPSVASLPALRRDAHASSASEPFIGFGNPVLTRDCGPAYIPDTCPQDEINVAAIEADGRARSTGPVEAASDYFRGELADVAGLKSRLCPLPDTAHELGCVAKSLGAPVSSVVLGKDMTETAVKTMPLDHYRIVHFATHGLLAGQTARLAQVHAEPALVFSPPDTATAEDDGLLTASEVAGLKLDADWVVMSACNTASGAEPGAETLSGLAKAFFYAGARALVVSHWPVNSYAATMLTSRTFAEMKKNPSIGRSEAFRRSMLALMSDKSHPWGAHPSVWAPFVVVGEGSAAR